MTNSKLFQPLVLGQLQLDNRIVVSPMCQYSATDGVAQAWHAAHLGSMAMSGAGLLFIEATAVNPAGRITPHCLGLYDDACESALRSVIEGIREYSAMPLALQIGHAGRKASCDVPWQGRGQLTAQQGGWQALAPSAQPFEATEDPPQKMSAEQIELLVEDFVSTAQRAMRLGIDCLELHFAHGYLVHQFLSPLSNTRSDEYGGSLDNRMRLALRLFSAVKGVVGQSIPLGVRISASDWVDGGWDAVQSIELCKQLQALGCDFVDVSSGGLSTAQQIPLGPGYQVPLACEIKNAVEMPVIAVGLITEPAQAEQIVASGSADLVALARGFLHDPRWPWRAATELGASVQAPNQYLRALPHGAPSIFT